MKWLAVFVLVLCAAMVLADAVFVVAQVVP
jgi:hypothetical protein